MTVCGVRHHKHRRLPPCGHYAAIAVLHNAKSVHSTFRTQDLLIPPQGTILSVHLDWCIPPVTRLESLCYLQYTASSSEACRTAPFNRVCSISSLQLPSV